jgi:AcrR family transcriptional regulator
MAQPGDEVLRSRERVIEAATSLFASHGYDATTTREIGRLAGLNIATVAYHVGGKRELYQTIMKRAYEAERTALETAVADFLAAAHDQQSTVQSAQLLVSRYLDFCLSHPHVPALWMRRWLSDAHDIAELEERYAQPLVGMVLAALAEVSTAGYLDDADHEMTLWTIMWSIHGFCCSGVLDGQGRRHGVGDPEAVARFRSHLHLLVARLLPAGTESR